MGGYILYLCYVRVSYHLVSFLFSECEVLYYANKHIIYLNQLLMNGPSSVSICSANVQLSINQSINQ